jgi:glutaredoxin
LKTLKVEGDKSKHKVLIYALSTCAWCKRAKRLMKDNKIAYEYVDVDLCSSEDREEVRRDIARRGGRPSFPTIIVDDEILITGFKEDKIREALSI